MIVCGSALCRREKLVSIAIGQGEFRFVHVGIETVVVGSLPGGFAR